MRITVLNGPNLDLLGIREPEIYGSITLATIKDRCAALADALGIDLNFKQSNSQSTLVNWIHDEKGLSDILIINPAAFSFHSNALRDALEMFDGPIIELHLSNIHARDTHHRHSIQSSVATAAIFGLGAYGYVVALVSGAQMIGAKHPSVPYQLLKPL